MPIDTVASLLSAVKQYQLLGEAEAGEAAKLRARFTEPRGMAREMLQRGWLTPYQVNQIFAGKAAELLIGSYVILERLGEGGMGQVFKARHATLGRLVAIKVIRKERLGNPQALKRFQREIQAVSQLAHPNVVLAYDADQVGDTHLFAMEYVEGLDLGKLVKDKGPLPISRACDYVRQAAFGLQHAFERGMVHRDIKPNNLLLASGGNGSGQVKVLDMGLARTRTTVEDTTLTKEGSVMGTPDYIAPEQAKDARKADIRADLYSLGCTFYFMLTGRVPFTGGSMAEKLIKHLTEPPPPLQKIRPEVPAGVVSIVNKLMAKKPSERFQTPIELADALSNILTSEGKLNRRAAKAVDERRATVAERKPRQKTCATARRSGGFRRLAAVVAGLGFLVLAAAVVLSQVISGGDPTSSVAKNTNAAGPTEKTSPQGSTKQATRKTTTRKTTTKKGPVASGGSPLDRLSRSAFSAERLKGAPPDVVAVFGDRWGKHYGPAQALTFNSTGSRLISGGLDGARIWDADTMRESEVVSTERGVYAVAVSPDGRWLAVGEVGLPVKLWRQDGPRTRPIVLQDGHSANASALALAFSKDSRLMASAGNDGSVIVWRITDDGAKKSRVFPTRVNYPVSSVAFSSNGRRLAAGSQNNVARIWDLGGNRQPRILKHPGPVLGVAFHPSKPVLATATTNGMHLWDPNTGRSMRILSTSQPVRSLTFTPGGNILIGGLNDGRIHVYDVTKGNNQPVAALRDRNAISALAVSPDRKRIASATFLGTVRIWDWKGEIKEQPLPEGNISWVNGLQFGPDDRSLISGSNDGTVRIWDLTNPARPGNILNGEMAGVTAIELSPDDSRLAAFGQTSKVRIWQFPGMASSRDIQAAKLASNLGSTVSFSPDGRLLVTGGKSSNNVGVIRTWNMRETPPRNLATMRGHTGHVTAARFAPGGRIIASASSEDGTLRFWDYPKRRQIGDAIAIPKQTMTSMAFSPGGKILALGTTKPVKLIPGQIPPGLVRLWDVSQQPPRELPSLDGNGSVIWPIAFSPDGQTLAAAGADSRITLWDHANRQKRREIKLPGPAYSLAYSRNGRYLATGNGNGTIYIIRLAGP